MSAQGFLFAHGEKLLVALVVAICALAFYGTLTNPETQSEATLAEINKVVTKLESAYANPGRPNLAQTRDFEQEITRRFQTEVTSEPVIAGLTTHIGVTKTPKGGQKIAYAYEIAVPELRVADTIGSIEIQVAVSDGPRPDLPEQYIADGPEAGPWSRNEASEGTVVNHARWAGVLVEYRLFKNDGKQGINDDWQPIKTPDAPNGVIPLSGTSGRAVMDGIEAWQTYDLRARLVVAATGTVDPDAGYKIGQEVLPLRRPLPIRDVPSSWQDAVERIQAPFTSGELSKYLAEPYTGPAPRLPAMGAARPVRRPAGGAGMPPELEGPEGVPGALPVGDGAVNLANLNYRYFVGAASPLESFVAKSATYLGLKRASPGMGDQAKPTATIIVKRLVKSEAGETLGWTPAVEYKLQAGDKVGKNPEVLQVDWSDKKLPYDLSTPFVVESVEPDIERILYYELKLGSVQGPDGWGKQLQLDEKTVKTDAVVLSNPDAGTTLRLLEFENIRAPRPDRWAFPAIEPGTILKEEEVFKQAPLDWETPDLAPKRPVMHDNKDLLLKLLGAREAQLVEPPYCEMPDGRVIYYYPPENEVYQVVIPGSEWDRHGGPKALADPKAPKPGQDPELPPDGELPPGMAPEEFDPEMFEPEPEDGRRRR